MRFLALFLAILLPLGAALWMADSKSPQPSRLPDEAPAEGEPLLAGADLADEHGDTPFKGRVLQLLGVKLRLIDDGELKCYASLGELERVEGKPRLKNVLVALFEKRKLRLTIEGAYAEGDAAGWLRTRKGPRLVRFGGGVVVHDEGGRELARVERLEFDIDHKTLRSDDHVVLRLAEQGMELEADGLWVTLAKKGRAVTLLENVSGSVAVGGGIAHFGCRGPAVIEELEQADHYLVRLEDEARIEHPLARASCPRIEAIVHRQGARHDLASAVLSGGVSIEIAQEARGGLESVKAQTVTITGMRSILLESLTAVRKGAVKRLGLGDRTLDITASMAELTLLREDERKLRLWEILLVEARVKDRHGPGHLRATRLIHNQATGHLELLGGFLVETGDGLAVGERLVAEEPGEEEHTLLIEGPKKHIEHTADGRLGPLGEGKRGKLVIRCTGPLRVAVALRQKAVLFRADGKVRVTLAKESRLSCGRLEVFVVEGKLRSLHARDKVLLVEEGRGARLEGEDLSYGSGIGRVTGDLGGGPLARVSSKEHGTIRARFISYHDSGQFSAMFSVAVSARLTRGGTVEQWRVYCNEARGLPRDKRTPEFLEASGTVIVKGPDEQSFSGNWFAFDGKEGTAVLRGEPARVQRGNDLRLLCPQIDLGIEDQAVAAAYTSWPATIEFRPKKQQAAGRRFALVRVDTKGATRLAGLTLTVAAGAAFQAYDEKGRRHLDGSAKHVVVHLERKGKKLAPGRVVGSKGVQVNSWGKRAARVTADGFVFTAGKQEVDLRGNARVKAKGWDPEVAFERLVFVLAADGVDLKRASSVRVSETRR